MKLFVTLFALALAAVQVSAQTDLQRLVDTEHAFAQTAAEKGTRVAFLANMADDGLVFTPDKVNGKEYWTARKEGTSLLSWAPNYADVSSNGLLGYTTGNWEFRAKGKDDTPSAFGDFITVWLRYPDGKYKFVVDIGVGHAKPEKFSNDWVTSPIKIKDTNEKNSSASDNANGFYSTMTEKGIGKAYEDFATDDLRAYREDKAPILGKKGLISLLKSEKATFAFAKRSVFFGSADLAYNTNTYTKSVGGKVVEKGNTMQIWKLIGGKWKIVLDIFKPVA
ncbi:hypothetical protein BH10ACI2_BH10ACI2_24860 [soil metagenome]